MSTKPDPTNAKVGPAKSERQERLARALRENLRRRKDQERAREATDGESGDPGSGSG